MSYTMEEARELHKYTAERIAKSKKTIAELIEFGHSQGVIAMIERTIEKKRKLLEFVTDAIIKKQPDTIPDYLAQFYPELANL